MQRQARAPASLCRRAVGEGLKSLFRFTKRARDAALEAEFRRVYQDPGATFLLVGCLLAVLGFGAAYAVDVAFNGFPFVGPVQSPRLLVIAVFMALAALFFLWRPWALRNYAAAANFTLIFGFCVTVWVAATIPRSALETMWSMNTSLAACLLIAYGASRLTTRNTALIVLAGCALGVFYTTRVVVVSSAQLDRLIVNLSLLTIIAHSLRVNAERQEWRLFTLAKENLRSNEGNAAKMRFLANMSHEVRTPMSGVLQVLDLVGESASPRDQALIQTGKASGAALLKILSTILDYSALTQGTPKVVLSPVNLSDMCQTVVSLHMAALRAKQLELKLRVDLASGEVKILTDEVKLFEIVNNLVSNAIKFTNSGFVELSVEVVPRIGAALPEATLAIRVVDSGVGISPKDQQHVFSPFFQADSSTSRKTGGTGLGLSIVQGLAAALGGSIEMTSQLGVGTTMLVQLPVEVVAVTDVPPSQSQAMKSETSAGPMQLLESNEPVLFASRLDGRVLLVEDNDLNVVLCSRMLELNGFEVVVASNGLEAVREVRRSQFDIILMDCQMPQMDGYDAARRIRVHEQKIGARPTPILAVTANTLNGDKERCIEAGMNDYLAKGYDAKSLRDLLLKWLPRPPRKPNSDIVQH